MKLKYGIFLLFLALFVTSCTQNKSKRSKSDQAELHPFLFKTNYFIGEADLNYSFPVWFNDSILTEKGIKSIVHSWYSGSADDETSAIIQKVRRYSFDESGVLLSVQQKRYYENMVIENITFLYKGAPDKLGFATLKTVDSLQSDTPAEFTTYSKDKYHKSYAVYENDLTGDFLFCLLRKRLQGIVSVDSMFAPTPDDIINYGLPSKPYKRYQIENFVKEKNVSRYRYFKSSSELAYCKSDNYPFSNKKYVTVADNGKCTGFIDSTFSADNYLNRTVSTFSYDEKNLPSRLSHDGMRKGDFETFDYLFFE